MQTSMLLLRDNNACVDGFTRMASFMGVQPSTRDIYFPIWLVGLFGRKDDTEWAMANAMKIVPEEFAEFKMRTSHLLFRARFWTWREAHKTLPPQKSKSRNLLREAILDGERVTTSEQVEDFLRKWSQYQMTSNFWNELVTWPGWNIPSVYLLAVLDKIDKTWSTVLWEKEKKNLPPEPKVELKSMKKTYTSGAARLELEESSGGADAPVAVEDGVEEDERDWSNSDRPAKSKHSAMSRPLYFPRKPGQSNQEAFASLFTNGLDPYAMALQELDNAGFFKASKAPITLTQLNSPEDQPPIFQATFSTTDPMLILRLHHLCQAARFNIAEVLGIDKLSKAVQKAIGGTWHRYTPNSMSLTDLVGKTEETYDKAALQGQLAMESDRTHSRGRNEDEDDEE